MEIRQRDQKFWLVYRSRGGKVIASFTNYAQALEWARTKATERRNEPYVVFESVCEVMQAPQPVPQVEVNEMRDER